MIQMRRLKGRRLSYYVNSLTDGFECRLVFQYIFIPWLQHELDIFTERFSNAKPRYNMHKILPHGRPNDIFYHPEKFDSRDFSVSSTAQFHQPVTERGID